VSIFFSDFYFYLSYSSSSLEELTPSPCGRHQALARTYTHTVIEQKSQKGFHF
jgi:hypothetical protein